MNQEQLSPSRVGSSPSWTCAGFFAGIGGIELGFRHSGVETSFLCEIDPAARAVLEARLGVEPTAFPADILGVGELPRVDVVAAGFPCQDLSMAGRKTGISGQRSGLITALLGLLERARHAPRWLVVENVPYMLHLGGGQAMEFLATELERIGYRWGYRVLDARAFGVPQRRLRVMLVASQTEDPCTVLFGAGDEVGLGHEDSSTEVNPELAYGFYWTEGRRGLGWTVDGVPTIKGGSTLGIPSAPAIWHPATGEIGTPDIRDLERLQGFEAGWTEAADGVMGTRNSRWKLVGNAVCVRMAEWVGRRIREPSSHLLPKQPLVIKGRWPGAAFGGPRGGRFVVDATPWPTRPHHPVHLTEFLEHPLKPLSARAATGYLSRAKEARSLRFPIGFLEAVAAHRDRMLEEEVKRPGPRSRNVRTRTGARRSAGA